MSKQQKRSLYSLISFFGWIICHLISIALLIITLTLFSSDDSKGIGTLISMFLLLIGTIFLIKLGDFDCRFSRYNSRFRCLILPYLYGFRGVPNNKSSEFNILIYKVRDKILIYEIEKGLFETEIDDKIYKFDMNGWCKKKKYIHDIIISMFQIHYSKGEKKLMYRSVEVPYQNIYIEFIDLKKNIKIFYIVKNYKTKLKFSYRISTWLKLSKIDTKKITLNWLYDLN